MDIKQIEKYNISETIEKKLFQDAIIVYDTSALLDFYYFSDDTKSQIFNNLFKKLKNRLWLPHQVEFEFLRNKTNVINKPIQAYKDLISINKTQKDSGYISKIEETISELKTKQIKNIYGLFKTFTEVTNSNDKHPYLENNSITEFKKKLELLEKYIDGFDKSFSLFKDEIKNEIEIRIADIDDFSNDDSVLKNLNKYFSVGEQSTYDEIIEIVKEGEIRYRNNIPPGYEDEEGKIGFQIYGDLILWKQLINKAITDKKPVIFITNDNKEDWWYFDGNNRTKQPRFELIKEINDKAGIDFWMYNSTDFLYKANNLLKAKIEPTTIEEVSKVLKARKISIDDEMFTSWIQENFKSVIEILFFDDHDNGIDYVISDDNGVRTGIAIYKSKGTRYTSVFIPVRDMLEIKNNLKKNNNINNLIFLLIADSQSSAESLVKHVTRKNPLNLLKLHKHDFKFIIGYPDGGEFIHIFDSEELLISEITQANILYK